MNAPVNDEQRWKLVEDLCARCSKQSTQADADALRGVVKELLTTAPGRERIRQGLDAVGLEGKRFAIRELANILTDTGADAKGVPEAEQRTLLEAAARPLKGKAAKDPVFWSVLWLRLERGDSAAVGETVKLLERFVKDRKEVQPERALDVVEALKKVPGQQRTVIFERAIQAGLNDETRRAIEAQLGASRTPPKAEVAKAEVATKPVPVPERPSAPEPPPVRAEQVVPPPPPPAPVEARREESPPAPPTPAAPVAPPVAEERPKPGPRRERREPPRDEPPRAAADWIGAAAPLLAMWSELAEKIDAIHRRTVVETGRARAAETESRSAEPAEREGELKRARAETQAAEREHGRLSNELAKAREELQKEQQRVGDMIRERDDARDQVERAEQNALQALHDAELVKQTSVASYQDKVHEAVHRFFVDVPETETRRDAPETERLLRDRLRAVRSALRELGVILD